MVVSKNILLIFTMLACLTASAYSQTITQDDFLGQLIRTHPLFEKERLTARIAEKERYSFLGERDWMVEASLFYSHEEPSVAFSGPERTDAVALGGGISRLFWSTGGRFSASLQSSRAELKLDPVFGFPSTLYENKLSVSYVHPLMQNRHGVLDRLKYDLKEYDINLSEILSIENQEEFLANSAAKFLDWVLLSEKINIIEERLRLSEEQLANAKERRNANLIDEVDVIRAEDAVRIARQSLMMTESQWKALQAELAVLAQDPEYFSASPQFDIYRTVALESLDTVFGRIREKSRLVHAITTQIDQLSFSRRGYEEIGKPELSLVAEFNVKNAEDDIGGSLQMDKPDAMIGLKLGFPIENRTSSMKIAQTDLQVEQLEKQLEELILELQSASANLYTQITELEKVLELNREQIESARQKTEEEQKLYNQGRGDLTFVIQSRDSEQQAKLTYAANALSYHKLLLRYRSLLDQLY